MRTSSRQSSECTPMKISATLSFWDCPAHIQIQHSEGDVKCQKAHCWRADKMSSLTADCRRSAHEGEQHVPDDAGVSNQLPQRRVLEQMNTDANNLKLLLHGEQLDDVVTCPCKVHIPEASGGHIINVETSRLHSPSSAIKVRFDVLSCAPTCGQIWTVSRPCSHRLSGASPLCSASAAFVPPARHGAR